MRTSENRQLREVLSQARWTRRDSADSVERLKTAFKKTPVKID
jgi:hypothetical protein